MKRNIVLAGFSLFALLSSCSDGDIVYKDINLDGVTNVQRCGTTGTEKVFFKLNKSEAMILVVDADNIMQDQSVQVQTVEINGSSTSLEYRKYASDVTSASICNTPPPGFPVVLQQISAAPGGSVQIRRDISIDNKTTDVSTGINTVGLTYQYTFLLQNINFVEGETNIKYDRMPFGTNNYDSKLLSFKFTDNDGNYKSTNTCNNTLIALSDKEALILNIDPANLPTEEGTVTIPLSSVANLIFKQYYRAGININDVCNNEGDIPGSSEVTSNKLVETWVAENGNVVISSRWTNPADGGVKQFEQTITLQNVMFNKKGYTNLSFTKPYLPFGIVINE